MFLLTISEHIIELCSYEIKEQVQFDYINNSAGIAGNVIAVIYTILRYYTRYKTFPKIMLIGMSSEILKQKYT